MRNFHTLVRWLMPFKVWSEGNSPGKPSSTPSVGLNLFFFSLSWALSLCCLQHSQWSLFHNYLHVCPSPLLYCSFFKGGDYVLTIYFSVPCYPKCTTWNKQKPRMSVWEKNEEMNIVYIPPWHHKAGPIPQLWNPEDSEYATNLSSELRLSEVLKLLSAPLAAV